MKIRNGFVSNSSSSSYIIIIDQDWRDVLENIYYGFVYSWFEVKEKGILEHLNNKLSSRYEPKDNKEKIHDLILRIEDCQEVADSGELIPYYKLLDYDVDEDEGGPQVTERNYYIEIIMGILKYVYDIEVEIVTSKTAMMHNIKFSGISSMHNSFSDIPEILKDIITYYTFEHPTIKIETERIED